MSSPRKGLIHYPWENVSSASLFWWSGRWLVVLIYLSSLFWDHGDYLGVRESQMECGLLSLRNWLQMKTLKFNKKALPMNPCFKTTQIRLGSEGKKSLWGNLLQIQETKLTKGKVKWWKSVPWCRGIYRFRILTTTTNVSHTNLTNSYGFNSACTFLKARKEGPDPFYVASMDSKLRNMK